MRYTRYVAAIMIVMSAAAVRGAAPQARDNAETVMVTLHAKAGAEADLARVIAKHWEAVHRLNLVRDTPHVTLRGRDNGHTFFVEIFTWRDADIPDNAPAEIQGIWAEMNALVEKRGEREGLEIAEVSLLPAADPAKR